jgi:hypothetical protein
MAEERTAYGAPLDPEEAALLAALRARGLNELAEMALWCIGESYGHAGTALREFEAAPAPACSLGAAHVNLRAGAQCPACYFIAPALPPEIAAVQAAGWKAWQSLLRRRTDAMLGITAEARQRFEELAPKAFETFGHRPAPPHPQAATPKQVMVWYRANGLHVSIRFSGDQLAYDFIGMIEEPTP